MVVAFTGYRPEKMPFSEDCKNRQYLEFRRTLSSLIDCLIKQGFTYFISGVARGFDTWVAEEVSVDGRQIIIYILNVPFRFRDRQICGKRKTKGEDIKYLSPPTKPWLFLNDTGADVFSQEIVI